MPRRKINPKDRPMELPVRRANLEATIGSHIAAAEIAIPPLELDNRARAAIMERPEDIAQRLLDLLNQAERQGITPEEFAELLYDPNMTVAMVKLVVEWSCRHYESGLDELNTLLGRGPWVERQRDEVLNGYIRYRDLDHDFFSIPRLDLARVTLEFEWPPEKDNPQGRERGLSLLADRERYGGTLEYVIRTVHGVGVACANRIYESSEPYATLLVANHNPDNPAPPLCPQQPPWSRLL